MCGCNRCAGGILPLLQLLKTFEASEIFFFFSFAVGGGGQAGILTFPFATALHLNLRLASARSRASCSSLANVQCRFWLLLWYIVKSEIRPKNLEEKVS